MEFKYNFIFYSKLTISNLLSDLMKLKSQCLIPISNSKSIYWLYLDMESPSIKTIKSSSKSMVHIILFYLLVILDIDSLAYSMLLDRHKIH